MKRFCIICLSLVLCFQLFGCAAPAGEELPEVVVGGKPRNLMAAVVPAAVEPLAPDRVYETAAADFALRLLQESYEQGGVMLSPYSLYIALAMTANGAEGKTLAQLENAMGLPSGELNRYLYSLGQDERQELLLANSIWFREASEFQVKKEFLQTNGDYYGAELFAAAFNENTVAEINAWVAEHTKDRIPELIQKLNANDCMVLLNALCFDGEWAVAFESENSFDGSFTAYDGSVQEARMMQGSAEKYIRTENATGFVKEYENGFSFLALLPEEGISIEDYIAELTGEGLLELWRNAALRDTAVTMPRFHAETTVSAKDALQGMGIANLFSEQADLGRISEAPLFVSEVMHSCSVEVDEAGTKAAAASSVIITYKGVPMGVTLNRPFVMAIMDNETGTILFLGTVETMEQEG